MTETNKAVLDVIAKYYGGQLQKSIFRCGRANIPPERVVEDIAEKFLSGVGDLRWCEGYGHPHFWQSVERLAQLGYEVRCEEHQERRKTDRRKP